jgi:putative oxidoreductase
MGIAHHDEVTRLARIREWLVLFRVILGLLLLFKGISFISHANELENMIAGSRFKIDEGSALLAAYICIAHLSGGVFIIIGLLTRIACLFQLPILIGAVLFVNSPTSVFHLQSELILSIIVLLLLIVFIIAGGGPFSIDQYIKKHLL